MIPTDYQIWLQITQSSANTAYDATHVQDSSPWDLSAVTAGMRVRAGVNTGIVTAVNDVTNVVTVDAWAPSQPVNGTVAAVDELDYKQSLFLWLNQGSGDFNMVNGDLSVLLKYWTSLTSAQKTALRASIVNRLVEVASLISDVSAEINSIPDTL